MQINTFKTFLISLFLSLSFFGYASENDESKPTEEAFNVTDMIMHHIKDAHDFHILDWKGHAVSFPLPIILWTDNGLVTFMSSEFHHDDKGEVVTLANGLEVFLSHTTVVSL